MSKFQDTYLFGKVLGVRLRKVKTITISYYQTVYERRDTVFTAPSGQQLENMDPDTSLHNIMANLKFWSDSVEAYRFGKLRPY